MATKNEKDSNGSYEMGLKAEDLFLRTAEKHDWKVTKATRNQDRKEHWDFLVERCLADFKIEVKARKRISRSDKNPQDGFIWLELHGEGDYNKGWLLGTKADLIAFETENSFLFVKPSDLINLVKELIDFKEVVSNPTQALYKLYSRNNNYDLLTLIKLDDLYKIKFWEWEK